VIFFLSDRRLCIHMHKCQRALVFNHSGKFSFSLELDKKVFNIILIMNTCQFHMFNSPEVKSQVSFCDHALLLLNFHLLQNNWAINQTWHKSSYGEGIRICSRGDNSKSKNTLKIFKNLFLQNQLAKFNQTLYHLYEKSSRNPAGI
jgi:hypothetical protein